MAGPYVQVEDSFAAATEVAPGQLASNGPFAIPTANGNSIEVREFSIEPNASDVERSGYPRGSAGELPVVPGGRMADVSVTVEAKYDGAGTAPEAKPLLLASGLQESSDVYTVASPIAEHSQAFCAGSYGDRLRMAPGCAFNMVFAGSAGEAATMAFSGQGLYLEPEALGLTGNYTVDNIAPPVADKMLLTLTGAKQNGSDVSSTFADINDVLLLRSFSLDLQNQVAARGTGALRPLPNFAVVSDDGSVDETGDSNQTSGTVVFAASPAQDDFIAVGFPTRDFSGLKFNVSTAGSGAAITMDYSDGASSWADLATVKDPNGVDFATMGATGIGRVTWDPPNDWTKSTYNSISAYWVRFNLDTVGSTTPELDRIWSLVPSVLERAVVTDQRPRLTLDFELVDQGTFDPMFEFKRRVTRTPLVQLGTADNNTWQIEMTDAALMGEPSITVNDGILGCQMVYGAGTLSLTAT